MSANGTRGLDLNGDGVPDVDYAGHTLPGSGAPLNARLVNGPGGALGYDINGDGLPDFDLSGNPLAGAGVGVPGGPGSQVVAGPGAIFGRPFNGPQDATAAGLAPATAGQDVLAAGGAGAGAGGPMMPPMYPPQPGQDKDGRETWLQEEDDVWEGDEELVAAVALGRAPRAATDDVPDEAWEEPPAVPKKQRPGPRSGPRPRAGGPWPQGGAR